MKILIVLLALTLLLAPTATVQGSNPTVAILTMSYDLYALPISGVLDALTGYGIINADERAILNQRQDLQGENVNIIWGSADLRLSDASLIVDAALDQEVDALVTISTSMSQIAYKATEGLDNPPVIFFTSVADPVGAGLAQDTCVKPAHVTGTRAHQEYEGMFDALQLLEPDLAAVGVLGMSGEPASEFGMRRLTEIAAARGVELYLAAISDLSQLPVATDGLVSKGVDALILPGSVFLAPASRIVVEAALDAQIPIVTAGLSHIIFGSPFGFGAYRPLQQGMNSGRMLANWLNGDLDVARTAISVVRGLALGMNMNTVALTQVEVPSELMAKADALIIGDQYQISPKMVMDAFQNMSVTEDMVIPMVTAAMPSLEVVGGRIQMPLANVLGEASLFASQMSNVNAEADASFLASLYCTDEMIAEQQAALDADE